MIWDGHVCLYLSEDFVRVDEYMCGGIWRGYDRARTGACRSGTPFPLAQARMEFVSVVLVNC